MSFGSVIIGSQCPPLWRRQRRRSRNAGRVRGGGTLRHAAASLGGVGLTPTVAQASITSLCTLLPAPQSAAAAAMVAAAKSRKPAVALRPDVRAMYQMRPATSHAKVLAVLATR